MTDDATLLNRFRPRLITFAQDTLRHRPWNGLLEHVSVARGDYHTCSAEVFLSFVFQRDAPRSFWAGVFGDPGHPEPIGLDELRARAAATATEAIKNWELDLGPIESQDGVQAWKAYRSILANKPFEPTIYGRCVRSDTKICLQYWFLSFYNDAPNRHEGDWEMVQLELSQAEEPEWAGYASHRSGLKRPWSGIERNGDQPLVYVARGSHASYFGHRVEGHRTNSFVLPHKGLHPAIEALLQGGVMILQRLMFFLRLQDWTPTHPERPGNEPLNQGEFVDPQVQVLPSLETVTPDSPFWWLRLTCPWGSRHTRLLGDVAPDPPWEQGLKWSNPFDWLTGLEEDSP